MQQSGNPRTQDKHTYSRLESGNPLPPKHTGQGFGKSTFFKIHPCGETVDTPVNIDSWQPYVFRKSSRVEVSGTQGIAHSFVAAHAVMTGEAGYVMAGGYPVADFVAGNTFS
jgi:hypothetical protein